MYKIRLTAKGQSFEYDCPADVTPLKAARDQFIPFPTGCQRGGCGMCKVKVTSGDYEQDVIRNHEYLSDEELENGFALGCCMTAKSDLELIAIEDYKAQLQEAEAVKK